MGEAEGWSGSTNPMATKEQKARRMRSEQANAPLLAMTEKLRNLRLRRRSQKSRLLRQPKEKKGCRPVRDKGPARRRREKRGEAAAILRARRRSLGERGRAAPQALARPEYLPRPPRRRARERRAAHPLTHQTQIRALLGTHPHLPQCSKHTLIENVPTVGV